MKKTLRNWIIMGFLLVSVLGINTSKAQGRVSLQVFYDELQPYGNWMTYGNYGYVWVPNVDRDFSPYATNGYWINTEYGNTWVSDYAWGWAPFHYGRWYYDDFYGWIWIPDTEWAPAWVTWRSGGGYYGWAPLMPGFNISVSYTYYNSIPHRYWNFVPYRYITYRTVHHHCVPRPQVINIINHTTIVTHNHRHDSRSRSNYFTGPSRNEIETTNREHVEVYKVSDRSRPGRADFDRGTVSFYKPQIDRDDQGRNRPAPSRVMNDDRGRNQNELLESRRERSLEFDNARSNNQERFQRPERTTESENKVERQRPTVEQGAPRRNFNPSDRTQQIKPENTNRESDRQRETLNHDQQRFQQPRSQPVERKPDNRPAQREFSSPHNQPRTIEKPQQHKVERQSNQQSVQRERPAVHPNRSEPSRSQPQREQQVRRSSEHQSQPARSSGGGSKGNSRKHD
jgi:hypothetical protein